MPIATRPRLWFHLQFCITCTLADVMFCPDCQMNLDGVPCNRTCPGCGGLGRGRRATNVIDHPLRTIGERTFTIDRPAPRPWWEHWKVVKIALASLGECYRTGVQEIGFDGVNRRTWHFFVECDHLRGWVASDDVNLPQITRPPH